MELRDKTSRWTLISSVGGQVTLQEVFCNGRDGDLDVLIILII